jgi:Protein kinase domain
VVHQHRPEVRRDTPWWKVGPRGWLGAPIASDKREAFAAELADTNRRRASALLPLMAIVHAVHVAVFRVSPAERAALSPRIVEWRDGLALVHGVTAVIVAMLAVAAWRLGRGDRSRALRWLGPIAAATYVLHGAVIASVDQLSVTSVTPFVAYCLAEAVIACLMPLEALIVYALGLAVFVPGVLAMQPSATARLAALPSGVTIVVVCVALSWTLHLARRRDFSQRMTIEEQRAILAQQSATLSELNVGLENRVREQTAEIVARAREVEDLNAQLHAKVRARSAELSIALGKLAQRDIGGGLQRGVVLGDRFEIEDLLGAGGMGAVYKGIDRTNGTPVAIKVIQASSSVHLDILHRFLREAATAAKVDHPAVVRMIHVDVSEDGMLFHAQELVDGETLQRRLRRGHRWQPGVAARLVSVLCDGLAAAHSVGVVHRDVKPANVMITRATPGLRLLDFGISKLHDDRDGEFGATRSGIILGTPPYMAPEQMSGTQNITDRADVYAVGVILFLLLTGRLPFEESTPYGSLLSAMLRDAPDVRSLEPDAPAALARAVARCLEKDPASRPGAKELSRELAELADGHRAAPVEVLEHDGALRGQGPSIHAQETLVETMRRQPA